MKPKLIYMGIFLLSLLLLFYFALHNTSHVTEFNNKDEETLLTKEIKKEKSAILVKKNAKQTAPLVVFLVSQCRSGSSILGEMFNQRKNVLFFYEPLYPFRQSNCFQPSHIKLTTESIQATRNIAYCQLGNMTDLYRRGYLVTKQNDGAKCLQQNICFADSNKDSKYSEFLKRDAPQVVIKNNQTVKVDLERLSQFCRQSEFVAAKINYLRGLENLTDLLPAKESDDTNVKVIHLVRDPRATVFSRFYRNESLSVAKYSWASKNICDRLLQNIKYSEDHLIHKKSVFIRVRHEDFAMDPIHFVEDIYKFIGKPPTYELLQWFESATQRNNGSSQSTQRNSRQTASVWRSKLDFARIDAMQKNCEQVLHLLGYTIFQSEKELNDVDNITSF